jgi:hypothetical protein
MRVVKLMPHALAKDSAGRVENCEIGIAAQNAFPQVDEEQRMQAQHSHHKDPDQAPAYFRFSRQRLSSGHE